MKYIIIGVDAQELLNLKCGGFKSAHYLVLRLIEAPFAYCSVLHSTCASLLPINDLKNYGFSRHFISEATSSSPMPQPRVCE